MNRNELIELFKKEKGRYFFVNKEHFGDFNTTVIEKSKKTIDCDVCRGEIKKSYDYVLFSWIKGTEFNKINNNEKLTAEFKKTAISYNTRWWNYCLKCWKNTYDEIFKIENQK